MIKVLRRKFIFTALLAIGILLLVMFTVLNLVNYISLNSYADTVLERLAVVYSETPVLQRNSAAPVDGTSSPGDEEDSSDSSGDSEGGESGDSQNDSVGEEPDSIESVTPLTVNFDLSSSEVNVSEILRGTFYTVLIDENGNAGFTDVTRVADVTVAQAQEAAQTLYRQNKTSGWYGTFKYLRSQGGSGNSVYFFLSRYPELYNARRIALLSIIIMVVCFGISWLLTALLSNRILRPVANNIEQQKSFVTNAGHEIKTPLAIIQANAEALELYNGENKWTSNIKDQTHRLSVLMNNMLSLAKAQEGITNLPRSEMDLSAVVRDLVRMFHEPAAAKNVTVTESIEEGIIINSNKVQVGQVISIVLDNAVKYCDSDSDIDICLERKDKHPVFRVSNACRNLPECEPERLFERFFRPDVSRYSDVSGNGIGLSAARSIMESTGGTITCSYEGSDRIVFTVTFRK